MESVPHEGDTTHEPARPFPVEVLPGPLAAFVNEVATALPCPPDFVAVPMLSLLGATIGTSRVLEVKPGWREGARMYTAVVADPGSKKSPALEHTMRPLHDRQRQMQEQYRQALGAYQPGGNSDEPVMQQLFTTDATLEALAVLLEQNPRGLAFIRDELTGWVRAMNQYKSGKGADRQSWLSFWNGATVIVNRKQHKEPIVLDSPFVCVAGCLPPDVLGDLADKHGREDGFLHRILFAFPDRMPLAWTDAALSQATQQAYADVFEDLWTLAPATLPNGREGPDVVQFTPEGRAAFIAWANTHYAEMASDTFPEHLRGPWAKMEGYCARLALILQACRRTCHEASSEAVDVVSVQGAVALICYFKSHTRRVYHRLQRSPEEQRITKAVAWLQRHEHTASLRDFVTYKVAGCKTAREAWGLFQELKHQGYGTMTSSTPPGGGPVTHTFSLSLHSANDEI